MMEDLEWKWPMDGGGGEREEAVEMVVGVAISTADVSAITFSR